MRRRDINPDPGGRPSPLALRLLVLSDGMAFDASSFASLARGDDVPGAALTGEMRLTLRPGETLVLPIRIAPNANEIGIFAEYSDPLSTSWRARLAVRDPSTGHIAPGRRVLISLERSRITSMIEQ
jgi:type VI secretion system protein VasD